MMSQTIFVCSIFTVIRDWVYDNIIANFAENAQTAGSVALLGMVTIFAVLAILWLVIEIFHAVLTSAEKSKGKPKKKAGSAENAPVPAPIPVAEPAVIIEEAPIPQEDEAQIVVAISAALAEYLSVPQSSFRVVSFRKAENGAHWNK